MTRPAFLCATSAVAWGAAFFVWALLGAAYSDGSSLAHAGDPVQVALVALPLVVAIAAWWILHRTCAIGASKRPATALAAITGAFSILGLASIGLFIAPIAVLVVAATATVEQPG